MTEVHTEDLEGGPAQAPDNIATEIASVIIAISALRSSRAYWNTYELKTCSCCEDRPTSMIEVPIPRPTGNLVYGLCKVHYDEVAALIKARVESDQFQRAVLASGDDSEEQ